MMGLRVCRLFPHAADSQSFKTLTTQPVQRCPIANLDVDHRVRLKDLAALLTRLVREPAGPRVVISDQLRREAMMAEELADIAALHEG